MATTTRIGVTKLEQAQLSGEVVINADLDQIDAEVAVLDQTNVFTGRQEFTGTPPTSTTQALVRLGGRALTGMSAAGTVLGGNLDPSFTGDLVRLSVNDAQVYRIGSGGSVEATRFAQSGGSRGFGGGWAWFVATVTPSSDADYTLTSSEYVAPLITLVAGSWASGHNVILPATSGGMWWVSNTSGFSATFKTAAGTGIAVANGRRATLACIAGNIIRISPDVDPTV